MTGSCKLSGRVDLEKLLKSAFCWRNRGFDAVSLRLPGPVTALVYSSGSVVFVGSKSEKQLENAAQAVASETGLTFLNLVIHNYCFSFMLQPLNLNRVFKFFRDGKILFTLSYDPELFPALTLTLRGTNRKVSLFHTGRVNIIGCKTRGDAETLKCILIDQLKYISV